MPMHSWPFILNFLNSLRSIFDDSNKLFQLSVVVHKWSQHIDWDFETKLKEEVVIVTDAKLRMFFASKTSLI
jgi:hypothetical protein